MADNNILDLTDQQIELCAAFSRAVGRFVDYISYELEVRDTQEEYNQGQFNSRIAGETVFSESLLESQSTRYIGAVKEGSQLITDSLFEAEAAKVPEEIKEKLTNNILIKLLEVAVQGGDLPADILVKGYPPSGIPEKLALKL